MSYSSILVLDMLPITFAAFSINYFRFSKFFINFKIWFNFFDIAVSCTQQKDYRGRYCSSVVTNDSHIILLLV